jgi:hypothetical protein
MKRICGLFVIVALAVCLSHLLTAVAQSSNLEKQVSLRGIVSDSMCGAKHMMSGDDAKCVRTCVKTGSPYALLVGNKVYELVGHDEQLDRLAGKTVEVAGTLDTAGAIRLTSVQPATQPAAKRASAGTIGTQGSPDNTKPPQTTTIEGVVRDMACPIQNENASAKSFNLKCALECVRLGSPIIIQTDAGTLYTPISSSMPDQDQRSRLMPFVGKYVRVRGQVFERRGTRAIMIQNIAELKEVHLVTDPK